MFYPNLKLSETFKRVFLERGMCKTPVVYQPSHSTELYNWIRSDELYDSENKN